MYKRGDIVVLLVHRLKEDSTTAIGIIEEVDENYLFLDDMWIHPESNSFNFNRVYQLNDRNKEYVKHLNDEEVKENAKSLFKILFEGKKI